MNGEMLKTIDDKPKVAQIDKKGTPLPLQSKKKPATDLEVWRHFLCVGDVGPVVEAVAAGVQLEDLGQQVTHGAVRGDR